MSLTYPQFKGEITKLAPMINKIAIIWLFIYLATLIVFALVYWHFSEHFYHTTAKHEHSLQVEELGIRKSFSSAIQENFLRVHPGKMVQNKYGVEYEVEHLKCTRFSFSEGGTLTLYVQINLLETGGKALRINNIQLDIQHTVLASDTNEGISYTTLFVDCIDKIEIPDFEISTFFPRNPNKTFGASMDVDGYIHIDNTLRDKYRALEAGWSGFPSKVKGTFGRMLYLSSVTITTLGSGDIVPVSRLTRFLVGSESVLGIIIMGLYLNALAKKFDSLRKNGSELRQNESDHSEVINSQDS